MKHLIYAFVLILPGLVACGQSAPANKPVDMPLGFEEYDPVSTLKVPEHKLTRSKYPFIDVHNHQYQMDKGDLSKLLTDMDSMNMGLMVNLSGRGFSSNTGDATAFFDNALTNIQKTDPKRLALFTNINFSSVNDKGWTAEAVKTLEDDVKKGAERAENLQESGLQC